MSLVKRLWIVVGLIIVATVLTAAIINIHSAQRYLENELKVKNLDTATALALTVSQSATDAVMVELLLSSQFDLGHYQRIDYLAPDGSLRAHRERVTHPPSVPAWFIRMFPIKAEPGVAMLQSGWSQLGSIRLYSDPSFAYDSLWKSTMALAQIFSLAGVLAGLLGMVYIRRVLKPLEGVVAQAEALADRRYLEVRAPRTLEFRLIIEAMNRLTQRTKSVLDGEAARLSKLKTEHEVDPMTGFMVREVFRRNAAAEIEREDTHPQGLLLLVHIANLDELNREIGRHQTDRLIGTLAQQMRQALQSPAGTRYGRLGASDFAILLPGQSEIAPLQQLHASILQAEHGRLLQLSYGAARYGPHSGMSELLASCDQSLTPASASGPVVPMAEGAVLLRPAREWVEILQVALRQHEFELALYPVRGRDRSYLNTEAPARIRSSVCGETLVAGAFLPWARREGLVGQVDLEILAQTLAAVERHGHAICINLGYESVCDDVQLQRLIDRLDQHRALAPRLCLDVAEDIAFEHPQAFARFCERILPLGCQVGVEHLDHHVGHLARLHGLGLHYVKLSRALVQDVQQEVAIQTLLRGLCTVAHTMGLQVIAEGVARADDVPLLFELGFDGVTGSAVA
ncbi:MAG: LapD/MoxY N-terminal periplasmic domain-containing protein [Hylemonella sp.]|nr:LapD/MoxY N-terminal periplasmic domain-containing protein [Hylemonella sp.]